LICAFPPLFLRDYVLILVSNLRVSQTELKRVARKFIIVHDKKFGHLAAENEAHSKFFHCFFTHTVVLELLVPRHC
jgi:hypothetical protein